MVKCSREVMMGVRFYFHSTPKLSHIAAPTFRTFFGLLRRDCAQAFEHLVNMKVFVAVSAASSTVERQFVKHRSSLEREEVKRTVEKLGTMSLKRWLGKSQQVHN